MSIARFIPGVFVVAIISMFAPAAPVPKDDKAAKIAAELKQMSGTWEVESAALGGKPLPKPNPSVKYEIKGSLKTVVATKALWTISLDLSTDPKRMTQTETIMKDGMPVPKDGGQVNRCVYALDGDKLTCVIARDPKGEKQGAMLDFPKSIPPKDGDPVLVVVLKRVKN